MKRTALFLVLVLAGCSKGGGDPSTSGGDESAEPLPGKQMGALLDGMPADSIAAGVLGMRSPFWHYLSGKGLLPMDKETKADFEKELKAHLERHLGLDVRSAQAVGVFVLPGDPPTGAAMLHGVTGELKGATESHAGGKLLTIEDKIVVALREPILLIGEREAVKKSLEVQAGDGKALKDSDLRKSLDAAREGAYFAAAANIGHPMIAGIIPMKLKFETASVRFSPKELRLQVKGDKEALSFIEAQFTLGTQVALNELESEKERNADEPLEGLATIIGYYNAKSMIAAATPKIDGDTMTVEIGMGNSQVVVVVAIVGMLSAVAIPAFMKYIKKSKSSEARMFVKKLYDGARVLAVEGKPLPPSAGPNPPLGSCCAGDTDGKCMPQKGIWEGPWRDLRFAIEDPHYYSVEFVNNGSSFSARAYGDLDCDGYYSTFEMYGELPNPSGAPSVSMSDELE